MKKELLSPKTALYLFFLFGLVPYSHIIPFFDVAGERFLYTPSTAFCLALPWMLHQSSRLPRRIWVPGVAILVGIFAVVSFSRGPDFQSTRTLLQATEEAYPDTYFANYELGRAYLRSNEPTRAIPEFQRAFTAVPLPIAAECALVALCDAGRSSEVPSFLETLRESQRGSAQQTLDNLAARWASQPRRDSLSCELGSMLETSP